MSLTLLGIHSEGILPAPYPVVGSNRQVRAGEGKPGMTKEGKEFLAQSYARVEISLST